MLFALLKWILIVALVAAGILFLATGLGADTAFIKYKGLETYGLPAGVALLLIAVALAHFWKITLSEIQEETHTETAHSDGTTTVTTTHKKDATTTFSNPDL